MATWLDVGAPAQAVDCVVVLPGDENVRPFVAAALAKAGLANKVLVPATSTDPALTDGIWPSNPEVIRRVLLHRGVPPEKIEVLPGASDSTADDAAAVAEFLKSTPDVRVAVVTSHYHTRRARWVFQRALKNQSAQISVVSAPTDNFGSENWWRSEEGFMLITGEYIKLAILAMRTMWLILVVAASSLAVAAFVVRRAIRGRRLAGAMTG